MLLRATGGRDAVDAAVLALLRDGDEVRTSDPHDLDALLRVAGVAAALTPI